MEPDELFHLEKGPESFSLTILPFKSESKDTSSSSASETVIFKKRREAFQVVYISDNLWPWDRNLVESEKFSALKPVLTTLGIESLETLSQSLCYVLQKDRESGWWIMWLAVSSKGDSDDESGKANLTLTLLFPQCKTKAAFWMEGMHSYVLSDWDHCLEEIGSSVSWVSHANIITKLDVFENDK
eukprot:s524_g13.t1